MHEASWPSRLSSAPLFWRVFALNALVFVVGVGSLALSPATVSWPLQPSELLVLTLGLVVLLLVNGLLLRTGLAPLDRLTTAMASVDLLRPGQRIPEQGSGRLAQLAHAFNEMLGRLESERAASSARALSAQEAERRRVARELHDEVGQSLTVVLLEVSRLADDAPESLRPMFDQLLDATRGSLADVRRIAQRLRPDALEELGLPTALTALTNEFTEFFGVPVRRRLTASAPLPEEVEVALYRIVQESLTNIARHAGARTVGLTLENTDDLGVRLVVEDDGTGMERAEGGGVRGMRERALLIGGDLQIDSLPGGGTRVSLEIPPYRAQRLGETGGVHTHSPG